ncbi:MAG: hypothetical protein AAF687_02165 [Pseudomonadota bacterium]
MKKTLITAIPLALGASLAFAVPVSAANAANPNGLRAEIRQLDRQINFARGLSHRQEIRLERRVDRLQRLHRQYLRGGLNRGEVRQLRQQIRSIKVAIRTQSRSNLRVNNRAFNRSRR